MRKSANRFDLLKEKKTKQIKEEEEEEEEDKFFDNKEIQRMRELAKKLSANLMKIKSEEGALNGESVKDNSADVKTSNCAESTVKQSKDSEKNGISWKEETQGTLPGPSKSGGQTSCDKGDNKYSSHHYTKSSSSKHESSPRHSHHKSHSKRHKKHHKKHKKRGKDAGTLSHG